MMKAGVRLFGCEVLTFVVHLSCTCGRLRDCLGHGRVMARDSCRDEAGLFLAGKPRLAFLLCYVQQRQWTMNLTAAPMHTEAGHAKKSWQQAPSTPAAVTTFDTALVQSTRRVGLVPSSNTKGCVKTTYTTQEDPGARRSKIRALTIHDQAQTAA